jgi:hypothetical protein
MHHSLPVTNRNTGNAQILVFSPSAASLIIHEPVREQHYRGTRKRLQAQSAFRHRSNCVLILLKAFCLIPVDNFQCHPARA